MTVIGITGGSGSGKSTLVRALVDLLGEERVAVLCQDHYYRDLSHLELSLRALANFDHPDALDLDLLAAHAQELRSGEAVDRPVYDMPTHTRTGDTVRVEPRETILVEGTLLGAHPELASALHAMVFVDLEESKRLARRVRRDVHDRGRTRVSVHHQWSVTVAPMFTEFVEPIRAPADLTVRGDEPAGDLAGRVAAPLHICALHRVHLAADPSD